jgi:hypothetical protein
MDGEFCNRRTLIIVLQTHCCLDPPKVALIVQRSFVLINPPKVRSTFRRLTVWNEGALLNLLRHL